MGHRQTPPKVFHDKSAYETIRTDNHDWMEADVHGWAACQGGGHNFVTIHLGAEPRNYKRVMHVLYCMENTKDGIRSIAQDMLSNDCEACNISYMLNLKMPVGDMR